jgi:hypothetical protein
MNTRIIINGKEVTSPSVKALLILGAIIVAALVLAIVIFVLFPIIGVAVSLSIGFIVIFIVAAIVSVATLALLTVIIAWLFGAAEFRIERVHKRK